MLTEGLVQQIHSNLFRLLQELLLLIYYKFIITLNYYNTFNISNKFTGATATTTTALLQEQKFVAGLRHLIFKYTT